MTNVPKLGQLVKEAVGNGVDLAGLLALERLVVEAYVDHVDRISSLRTKFTRREKSTCSEFAELRSWLQARCEEIERRSAS